MQMELLAEGWGEWEAVFCDGLGYIHKIAAKDSEMLLLLKKGKSKNELRFLPARIFF